MSHQIVGGGLGLAACLMVASPEPAEACGGFFCTTIPVVQTGERIVFAVDRDRHQVDAAINIVYQGAAPDFAWVLPLQSAPSRIATGSSWVFRVADQLTAPRFNVTFEQRGCPVPEPGSGADAGAASVDASAGGGGVTVLSAAPVGPYDSVVLSGTDPEAVRTWLVTNGFNVTDTMMQAVIPYLSAGDVLLALKLRKDNDVGDLQPIAVTMQGDEPCIPIRLTAIAAQADMDITAIVLARSRTVPTNYLHVEPNWARLDWLRRGVNYRQLIGDAVDEAGGNAFVTEYAGAAAIFRGAVYTQGAIDLDRIAATTNLADFIQALQSAGLFSRPEISGILARHVPTSTLTAAGVDPAFFAQCPPCVSWQLRNVSFDPSGAVAEIDSRIITPDREAQALFDRFPYVTRLFTLLSPEEMNTDPIFDFDPRLPDVSNVHSARVVMDCGTRDPFGQPYYEVTLETGRRFWVNASSDVFPAGPPLPASERVEDLATGRVVEDHKDEIDDRLDDPREPPREDDCTCREIGSRGSGGEQALLWLSAVLVLLSARAARSRRGAARRSWGSRRGGAG